MPDNSDCSRIPAPNIWAPKELVTVKPDMVEVSMQNVMTEIEKQIGFLTFRQNEVETGSKFI